jgi:LmbE family N-acetylglucosaminyl deacetylase
VALEGFPQDWDSALCIAAHPDDLEYGAAVAVAHWVRQGKRISYLLATRGEAGIDAMRPEDASRVREQEERASAAAVGVGVVDFLNHPDGVVEYGMALRRDLARVIRQRQPDAVIGVHFGLRWPGGAYNQADHRHVGLAVLDAVRDAANRWIFPELNEFSEPWDGVRLVAFQGSPDATHLQPVDGEDLVAGVASLRAQVLYLSQFTEDFDPHQFLAGQVTAAGDLGGVPLAVAFEVFVP